MSKSKLNCIYFSLLSGALLFWVANAFPNSSRVLVLFKSEVAGEELLGFVIANNHYYNPLIFNVSNESEPVAIPPPLIGQMGKLTSWMEFERYFPLYLLFLYLLSSLIFSWYIKRKCSNNVSLIIKYTALAYAISLVTVFLVSPFDKHVNVIDNSKYFDLARDLGHSRQRIIQTTSENTPTRINAVDLNKYYKLETIGRIIWVFEGVYDIEIGNNDDFRKLNVEYAKLQYSPAAIFDSSSDFVAHVKKTYLPLLS